MAGTVHISRGLQDEPNPALADPEVANYYLGLFMRKKLAGVRSTRDQSESSSAMPNGDYWDIDEILAEEQEVAIKSFHDIAGGGFLYPSSGAAKPRDLKEGAKVGVPFWLAQKLARRNCVEVALPAILDEAIRETLQSDPVVCRLGEKSRYYFEVGFKLAALRKDDQLREILLNAFMHRFRDLLGLTSSFGDPSRPDVTQPVQSQFLSSLTGLEEDFYKGAQEAESHFKRWAGSFSCYVMEASHVAEVSAAKRAFHRQPGVRLALGLRGLRSKLFYFLGPSPAMLALCPLMAEDDSQVFRTLLQPGSVVVVRGEACSCHLNPQLSEPCVLLEVDFFPEMKHSPVESASDRVPPPPDLQSWLLGRLKAIVDNDVQENVPEEWIKLARQTFMRSRPMKILEICHQLPSSHRCAWEGMAIGGFDCIVEIPKTKWDVDQPRAEPKSSTQSVHCSPQLKRASARASPAFDDDPVGSGVMSYTLDQCGDSLEPNDKAKDGKAEQKKGKKGKKVEVQVKIRDNVEETVVTRRSMSIESMATVDTESPSLEMEKIETDANEIVAETSQAETAQKEVEKPSDSGTRAPRPEVEASLWLDVKPAAEKSEERTQVLAKVSALGTRLFNEDPLAGCSKRGGWRLHIAVGQSEVSTELLGFIVFRIKPEKNAMIVAQLAVPEEHRRFGFGSTLLKCLIAEAKRLPEVHTVGLSSLPSAVKFYRRHGFKLVQRLPDTEDTEETKTQSEGSTEVPEDEKLETLETVESPEAEAWETLLWLDLKPAAERADPKKRLVLEQITALGEDIFSEDPLSGCSKRGGWRIHIAAGQLGERVELMGFVVFRVKPEKQSLIIAQLAVPEAHRRHGFGSWLLKTLVAEAKRLPQVQTVGLSSLPGSVKFYKRHGFKLLHRLPDNEAKAEGQVYMELRTPRLGSNCSARVERAPARADLTLAEFRENVVCEDPGRYYADTDAPAEHLGMLVPHDRIFQLANPRTNADVRIGVIIEEVERRQLLQPCPQGALAEAPRYFDPDPSNRDDNDFKMYTRHMGALEPYGLDFESGTQDLRQMLLKHTVDTCFGQAGLSKAELREQRVGFFCGLSGTEMYQQLMGGEVSCSAAAQSLLSNGINQIAWLYGAKGPSICVNTEESSGAAALDAAVGHARADRCNKAVVCSAHVIQHPISLILYCALGQLSSRGRAFDESSDGVVRSEASAPHRLQQEASPPATNAHRPAAGERRAMRLWLLPLLAAASGALEEVPEVPEVPEAPEPEERAANYSLSVESCRRYVLEVSSHGPGFYQDANLHRYTRCLFVLRHAPEAPKDVFVGGQHHPTVLVVNHREPSMRYAPEPPPRGPRRKLADIPLQPFQDTAAEFARLEMRTPHHFVLPYFDVNIGHAIKNQGSMNHLQSYQMQLLLRSGDTAIDVGANLGCYTIALAEAVGPRGSVIFFEPYRWLHQLVVANVALNGLQNVFPVQAALGESEERTWVYPPQLRFFSSPGGVRVAGQAQELSEKRQHEAFQLYDLLAQGPEAVRVVRLDDLLLDGETASRWALPQIQELRLIKIDVEGMEVAVVRGALGVISHFRPIIWAENLAYFDSGGKDTEFLQALAVVGYQCAKAESAPGDMICTDAGEQMRGGPSVGKGTRCLDEAASENPPRLNAMRDTDLRFDGSEASRRRTCRRQLPRCCGRAIRAESPGQWPEVGRAVAVLLESFGRWARHEADLEPIAEDWDEELETEDFARTRLVLAGSSLNSRGESSSVTAPSGPAMQDLIQSALRDSKYLACVVDAVEASAGGTRLMDAVEHSTLRKTLNSGDSAKVIRSWKSVIGETGPPGGLAALARACLTVEKAIDSIRVAARASEPKEWGHNHSWQNRPCDGHGICWPCLRRHAEIQILHEGRFSLRCPGDEACNYRLIPLDVERALESSELQEDALGRYDDNEELIFAAWLRSSEESPYEWLWDFRAAQAKDGKLLTSLHFWLWMAYLPVPLPWEAPQPDVEGWASPAVAELPAIQWRKAVASNAFTDGYYTDDEDDEYLFEDDDLWMAEYGKVPTKPWRGGGVSARVMRREDRFVKGPMRWKPQKAWTSSGDAVFTYAPHHRRRQKAEVARAARPGARKAGEVRRVRALRRRQFDVEV
ncbi:unnamed protein product [Effrenium voratum]|nr:unnamed protein product [Effrenium voratum]